MSLEPVETFVRFGSLVQTYSYVVEKNYSSFLMLDQEINGLCLSDEVDEYDERLFLLNRDKQVAGIETIVFSSMCFEASIYEFAAVHLGDEYVKRHIDKLDVLSKWVIILRFVSGVELKMGEAPYAKLKKLITARNNLIHAKSERASFPDQNNLEAWKEFSAKQQKMSQEFEGNVHNAFSALVTMSLYLDVIQEHYNPLPAYDDLNFSFRGNSEQLRDSINVCKGIVKKLLSS